MAEERIKESPAIVVYVNPNHSILTLEIALPGVEKEDIKLRLHEDSFSLCAPGHGVEYVASMAFCCPVKPEEAKAKYTNGLLEVRIPFKDLMEDALDVKIE